jgi:multidrug efflux pump subunit AcrA (membrane-fusion protein)
MNNSLYFICFIIISSFCLSPKIVTAAPDVETNEDNSVIIFEGKLSCPLSRPIFMPFTGIYTDINITAGKFVKKDTIVARYRLDETKAIQLGREILFNELDDLRRYQEIEKQTLIELERKEEELLGLTAEELAPKHLLDRLQRKLQLTREYLSILDKRSTSANYFSQRALNRVRELLGDSSLVSGEIPEIVTLRAPISGVVLSLHPQLRKNSLLPERTVIATVGTMDTMLIQSLVYERDVVHLNLGDLVTFFPDSLPERNYPATITSINWIPATPTPDLPSYYQVEMTVVNDDFSLRAGFKGRIEHKPQE